MIQQIRISGIGALNRLVPSLVVVGWLLWSGQAVADSVNDSEGATDEASQQTMDELMATGEEVYSERCGLCHQPDGMGLPGVYPPLVAGAPFEAAPRLTQPLEQRGFYEGGKIVLGPIDEHIDIVVNGIQGTRMFAFGPELTNEEVAAVVTYERNAWGNDTGEVVTPEQVEPFRDQ